MGYLNNMHILLFCVPDVINKVTDEENVVHSVCVYMYLVPQTGFLCDMT